MDQKFKHHSGGVPNVGGGGGGGGHSGCVSRTTFQLKAGLHKCYIASFPGLAALESEYAG